MTYPDDLPPAPPPGAILESALYADNLAAAAAFYGDVMGLAEVVRVEGRHIFYRVGQGILLIFQPDATAQGPSNLKIPVPPHGAHGPGHLCFSATLEEIDQWRHRLQAAGHPIEADFEWPNGARSIYFRDPAGNSIEIAEPSLWFDKD
ncbi:MAG: VOC family protein [Roseovarius sp.]